MTAVDLTGMTFDELTMYVRQWAALAKTRCPAVEAELTMIARVMEERGPGDAAKTRQYIADTVNACTGKSSSVSPGLLAVGAGLLVWFLLKG